MFEVTIPSNIRMPVPHHHRDWEETVYSTEGTTTFTVAGKRVNVAPGETLFIPRGVNTWLRQRYGRADKNVMRADARRAGSRIFSRNGHSNGRTGAARSEETPARS